MVQNCYINCSFFDSNGAISDAGILRKYVNNIAIVVAGNREL
jgi:hypothetical protein